MKFYTLFLLLNDCSFVQNFRMTTSIAKFNLSLNVKIRDFSTEGLGGFPQWTKLFLQRLEMVVINCNNTK